jgi:lipopolysaccharide export system permease protein
MGILQRYFWREMTAAFISVTLVLFAILCVNQVGTVLARAAELDYPRAVVWELIGLGALENVSILLPIGLLLGLVLALGRLHHDSEMVAAEACGLGRGGVLRPVLWLALPVVVLVAWLNLTVAPAAAVRVAEVRAEAVRAAQSAPMEAGRFRSFDSGRIVIYARSRDANGDLRDVFIKHSDGPVLETTLAARARLALGADGLAQSVVLYSGRRYEGEPGSGRYQLLSFEEQNIPLTAASGTERGPGLDGAPTAELLGATTLAERAELQWRLGLPVMALVLALLAIPLGKLRPRQGRYSRVWQAVLAFALYANLALIARSWLTRGVTKPEFGIWWVHLLFLALGALLVWGAALRRAVFARGAPA